MKKTLIIVCILVLCAVTLTGCGSKTINSLVPSLTAENLDDAFMPVSFSAADFDAEKKTLSFEVFDKVYYDVVDITEMKVKDTIVSPVSGKLVIKSIERDKAGSYLLNGGAENGGMTLYPEGGGVFCQMLATDDAYVMVSLGKTMLPVSESAKLHDDSDLDHPGVEVAADKLAEYLAADTIGFNARNTKCFVEGKVITDIYRVYIP